MEGLREPGLGGYQESPTNNRTSSDRMGSQRGRGGQAAGREGGRGGGGEGEAEGGGGGGGKGGGGGGGYLHSNPQSQPGQTAQRLSMTLLCQLDKLTPVKFTTDMITPHPVPRHEEDLQSATTRFKKREQDRDKVVVKKTH